MQVLVTGGKGQLASCIKDIANTLTDFTFIYVDVDELDITIEDEVNHFFEQRKIDYCINCAAYTAVDKAESESELAEAINANGAKYLAEACKKNKSVFIQVSTDFVFDGKQAFPYSENDQPNPVGVYGKSKWEGEQAITSTLKEHFIVRTAWLYSEHGNNFMKTMLRLGGERQEIGVVCDQIGTPTYARDLAKVIVGILTEGRNSYGTYHYSNEGVASWYDFTQAIFDIGDIRCKLLPIKTEAYPTPAKRPAFSVMDKSKIKTELGVEIPYWRDSLKECLSKVMD